MPAVGHGLAGMMSVDDADAYCEHRAFAAYSGGDRSLRFYSREAFPQPGEVVDGASVDAVYPADAFGDAPWLEHACEIESVKVVDEGISPGSMKGWFAGCVNLISCKVSRLDTSKVVDMSGLFYGCESLGAVDLSGFDTRKVASFERMFKGCAGLRSLDLSVLDASAVVRMDGLLCGCGSLVAVDLSGFDTSSAVDMGSMFSGCTLLSEVDLSSFDTRKVEDMSWMFAGCKSLRELNLSGFDTSRVNDMSDMFGGCEKLRRIDLSGFDTRLVVSFERMFSACEKLRRLDLSSFSVSKGADIDGMFWDCCRLSRLECADSSFEGARAPNVHPFERCWRLPRRQIADIMGGLPYGCWVDCEHCGDYFWHYIVFGGENVPKGAVTPGFMVVKLLIVLAGWTCSVAFLIWLVKVLS